MNKLISTIEKHINLLSEKVFELCKHHFIQNSIRFSKIQERNYFTDEAIILLDFAENYLFIIQDAVQGFHWENCEATLHPFFVYKYK